MLELCIKAYLGSNPNNLVLQLIHSVFLQTQERHPSTLCCGWICANVHKCIFETVCGDGKRIVGVDFHTGKRILIQLELLSGLVEIQDLANPRDKLLLLLGSLESAHSSERLAAVDHHEELL